MSSMNFESMNWSPSTIPTSTTLRSVAATKSSGLMETLTSATARIHTATAKPELISLSRNIRGAEASLSILQAENQIATATDNSVKSMATQAIFNATLNLKDLEWEENVYSMRSLSRPANIIYLVVFIVTFLYFTLMIWKSRFHWFNVAFFCGIGLEFAGFIGRVMSFSDMTDMNYYILQLVCLTIAPAFIMGGIYYLFAQLVVVYGREYSILRPMWYSYIFITCDVLSLIIQAGGGGAASYASNNFEDARPGSYVMIAGIAFQVFAMSFFLLFWFHFLFQTFFKHRPAKEEGSFDENKYDPAWKNASTANFFKMIFNTKSSQAHRATYLEQFYNPLFANIRARKLFYWFPLAMTIAVIAVYIRCIYRVVELAQGFSGYLITHEVYIMVLDALMIAITAIVFVPFHPVFVLGANNRIRLSAIKKNLDEADDNTANVSSKGSIKEENSDTY
ncbi:uncharacterized protein AC631_01605 [Debaryomyces fabryi]|uniref:Sphingoid long-chain base transporter RSB1 n=1 Tax=Debaryomyces fabryi TaxID=58627 RepID=A0A0V1Q2R8_9ASCO|nr:uncharacterized protein AC631_01605 [Debaryomyces fabryi]KSA02618.1 hypothetical protein AC631_01605 [Debaryomyces fabryi]CUM45727.1 unnamed protein product [Debaryomyces fabryi]